MQGQNSTGIKKIVVIGSMFFAIAIVSTTAIGMAINSTQAESTNKQQTTPQHVTLHMGQQGIQDFIKYTDGYSEKHSAGVKFHDLVWNGTSLGSATVVHNGQSLTFNNVDIILGSSIDSKHLGISSLDIDGRLTDTKYVTKEEAYREYVKLISQINDKGWQNIFMPSRPRISKLDNFRYLKETGRVVNPKEILTYEQCRANANFTL